MRCIVPVQSGGSVGKHHLQAVTPYVYKQLDRWAATEGLWEFADLATAMRQRSLDIRDGQVIDAIAMASARIAADRLTRGQQTCG